VIQDLFSRPERNRLRMGQ